MAGVGNYSFAHKIQLIENKNETLPTIESTTSYIKANSMIFLIGDVRESDSQNNNNEPYYDTSSRGHNKTRSELVTATNGCCFKQLTRTMGSTFCPSENHTLTRHKKSYWSFVCFGVPGERSTSYYRNNGHGTRVWILLNIHKFVHYMTLQRNSIVAV